MSDFITGKEIIEDQSIRDFEFFDDYIKKGLQPYDDLGRPIPPPDVSLKISMIRGRLEDAEREFRGKSRRIDPVEQARIRAIKSAQLPSSRSSGRASSIWKPPSPDEVLKIKEDLPRIEERIESLKEELSSIKDFSWEDYGLPDSKIEAKKVLEKLDSSLYIRKEAQKYLKLPPERPTRPQIDKDEEHLTQLRAFLQF